MIAACINDFRELARRRLPRFLFEYMDGGSYAEVTLRRNISDLESIALRQRVLRDVSDIDLSTELFGQKLALPVALAPIGLAGMNARRGECQAVRAADKAGIPLDYNRACAIDLACKGTGKTVLEAVRTSINPKVIDCPHPDMGRGGKIDAVAKDGISLRVRARVTVRTNLDRFVGGATEETVVARVGEGIVTCIGSSDSYKAVLENPDSISKLVLHKGVDAGTAFEILSIDIADIDVGENVGAKLQTEQAEADKKIAQAMAEMRRAAAVALEQEMAARTQEMRAKVVEAEAQVPLAISEAFRNGQLGVMDFAKYKNVTADTEMRTKIAGDSSTAK